MLCIIKKVNKQVGKSIEFVFRLKRLKLLDNGITRILKTNTKCCPYDTFVEEKAAANNRICSRPIKAWKTVTQ